MTLTNPRKRRIKKNPWHRDSSGGWSEYKEIGYESMPKTRARRKRSTKTIKTTRGTATVAKKRRKRSTWMSLVKKHGIKAAKGMYHKLKKGVSGTTRRRKRRTVAKHVVHHRRRKPVYTTKGKVRGRRRRTTIRISARKPVKIYASNPRRRRSVRRSKLVYRSNPRFPKVGLSSDILVRTAMVAAGFFGHRVISNWLTPKLAKWNVPQPVIDAGIPILAYFGLKQFKPLRNKVKYSNELLIGASVSAVNRLAAKLLPDSIGKYLSDNPSSVLMLPGNVAGYQVGGYQVGGTQNSILGGDQFLLGGDDDDME